MKKIVMLALVAMSAYALTVLASETIGGAKKDFENFKTEMQTKLDSAEKDLAELKAKAAAHGGHVKAETLAEFEQTRLKLKEDLAKMKESSAGTWAKAKEAFAKSVDNFNTKVQKAVKD